MTLVFDEVVPTLREQGVMDERDLRHHLHGEPEALADGLSSR